MATYKIVRKFFRNERSHTIATGLTLEEAKMHCSSTESSSSKCVEAVGRRRTKLRGAWMDCFYEE